MIYSDNGTVNWDFSVYTSVGKTLALLDDSGSVTFFSAGHMPCDGDKLIVFDDKNMPRNLNAYLNFTSKLIERSKPQQKR